MPGIAKEDIKDLDIVDSRELLSDGTDAYQSGVGIVSVTASTKTVVVSGGIVYNDDPVESGDLVTIAGNAAAGDYTVDTVTNDTTFTVVETTTDATGGTATFKHPPGALKVGYDPTATGITETTVQEALDDMEPRIGNALQIQGKDVSITGIADGDVLVYNSAASGSFEPLTPTFVPMAVSAYNSIFTMPTKSGTSDYVPFNTTEFEVGGTGLHDPTVSDSGTATGTQTSTTLQDTGKSWTTDQFAGYTVQLTGGTGSGQWRRITSNTSNTLTVGAWSTTPDGTTTYSITQYATRLVAPVAGVWEVMGHAAIAYQADVIGMYFYINGSFKSMQYVHQGQTIELHVAHSRLFNLSADDYVEMKIYNGDGSPRDLFAGIYRLTFQMHKTGG